MIEEHEPTRHSTQILIRNLLVKMIEEPEPIIGFGQKDKLTCHQTFYPNPTRLELTPLLP